MEVIPRITIEPDKMGGKACIRGHRFTVEHLLGLLADGMKPDEIIKEWDFLQTEDFPAAFRYAAYLASERTLPLAS